MNSFQQENRDNLVAYFQQGAKQSQKLGFELEHILVRRGTNAPVSYAERGGVHDVLEKLAPHYKRISYDGTDIVGLARCREVISIEPAGQLEISAGPFETVAQIAHTYQGFRNILDPILDEFGLAAPLVGYHPSTCARDLELVPKFRYECMTTFLGAQSPFGICMMRGTASLQVSIDYKSEQDALQKLRIAEMLAPIFALICDNSPIFEGQPRTQELVRTKVWSGMNQDRVGTIPGSIDASFTFADYADYILTREAILVPDEEAEAGWRYVANQTFDDIYAHRVMATAELEHALSMVWPDARLKNFVEVRPADALPPEYAFAYVALVRGLFYHPENLETLDAQLAGVDQQAIAQAKTSLQEGGYAGTAYGRPATYWTDLVLELAEAGAPAEDAAYLAPLATLIKERRTLADSGLS